MNEVKVAGAVPVTAEDVMVVRGSRVSWPALFAGTVVGLALWALLYVFGAAAGLTMLDPQDPSSAKVAGIGTGVWSLISPLIALFVGAFVTSRLASPITHGNGALHGAVLWGATTLVGAFLLTSMIGSLLGGVAGAARQSVGAVAGAVGGLGGGGDAMSMAGLSGDDLIAPINQRLRAAGKPEVTSAQMEAALRDVTTRAAGQGRLDRELLISSFASKTALSRSDAEQLATQVEQRWTSLRAQGSEQLQRAERGVLNAADTTGKVLWGAFGALLLGLLAALAGGAVGAHRRLHVGVPQGVQKRAPLASPGEVYP